MKKIFLLCSLILITACSKDASFNLASFDSVVRQSTSSSKGQPNTEIITTINGVSHTLNLEDRRKVTMTNMMSRNKYLTATTVNSRFSGSFWSSFLVFTKSTAFYCQPSSQVTGIQVELCRAIQLLHKTRILH